MTPSTTQEVKNELQEIFPDAVIRQEPGGNIEETHELRISVEQIENAEITGLSHLLGTYGLSGHIGRSGTGLKIIIKS